MQQPAPSRPRSTLLSRIPPAGRLARHGPTNTEGHNFKQMQERSQACVRVEEFQLRLLASSAFSILKRA